METKSRRLIVNNTVSGARKVDCHLVVQISSPNYATERNQVTNEKLPT